VTDRLFDAGPETPPAKALSSDRRRTLRQRSDIARGIHPLTKVELLRPAGRTCGECVHSFKRDRWWKCDRVETTGGPGTDLRVSWLACALFEEETT